MAIQAYAAVDANGNIKQEYAYSDRISSSGGAGEYTVTLGRPYNNPPVIAATLLGGKADALNVVMATDRYCVIRTFLKGNLTASDFMVYAIGD